MAIYQTVSRVFCFLFSSESQDYIGTQPGTILFVWKCPETVVTTEGGAVSF